MTQQRLGSEQDVDELIHLQTDRGKAWMFGWERDLMLWINSHHHPVLDAILTPISLCGEIGLCWILFVAALWFWGKPDQKRVAIYLAVAMALVSLCVVVPL